MRHFFCPTDWKAPITGILGDYISFRVGYKTIYVPFTRAQSVDHLIFDLKTLTFRMPDD